jgi:ABC-type nitrate/sulfonate/bicarbonate transport system substrate-binding protein
MTVRWKLALVVAAALVAFSCASAPPPAAEARKVVITYPNKSGSQWPLYLAKETGAYAKYGLDAQLEFVAFPGNIAALASGQSQLVNTSLEQDMQAASKDGSLSMIGSSLNRGTFALIANKNIQSVADLKKKKIAVTQIGDAPYGYVVAILAKAGMTARDVEWIPVGGPVSGRAAALTSGRADATILTAPAYFKLEGEGYKTLVNLAERDDIFASTAYLVQSKDAADATLTESLVKAHADAIKTFYEDKAAAIAAYRKYDPNISAEDADRTYELYAKPQAFERVPYVLKAAVEAVLAQQSDPQLAERMKAFDWKTVIRNNVVDKLVAEGFFVGLFGDGVKAEQERKSALAFGK